MDTRIDLPAAISFVNQFGSTLEKARLNRVLGQDVDPQFLKPLLDLQNRDGGFPSRPRPGSASSVDSTLTALWQLYELDMFELEPARHALAFLEELQDPDGSWDENPELPPYDLPPWIQPGEPATKLYLTAYAAFWLGKQDPQNPAYRRALQFLAGQQEENGRLPGYTHTNWIAASAFLMAGEPYQTAFEKILAYLQRLPLEDWDDSQIAWALDNLGSAGLPVDHPFAQASLLALVNRQSENGSWASEDGPGYAASATVSTLKAIKHYRPMWLA